MERKEANTVDSETWKAINEVINIKSALVGIIGGLATVMYRSIRKKLKGWVEIAYILFVGCFFTAYCTEPVMSIIAHYFPQVAGVPKIRDAVSLFIGVLGWAFVNFLIEDLVPFGKRWILAQVKFAGEEATGKKKDDERGIN